MEYYLVMKKTEIFLSATTWMALEGIMVSKISQIEKDKYCVISLICGIQNMTQMNLSMKQKQNHRRREQTGGCQA